MKAILTTIAKIIIRSIIKSLTKDVVRYDERAKKNLKQERKLGNVVAKRASAKRAKLHAKMESTYATERADKAFLAGKVLEAQAKRENAKKELAKFSKFEI